MYTHLIISGGGIKGAAMIGALHVIKNLEHIHTFAGSSVGGLICLLLAVGYTPNDLYHMLVDIDFQEYIDYNFIDFFDNIGIVNGDRFITITIDLSHISSINLAINREDKIKMYQIGIDEAHKFYALRETKGVP